ncbi:MarR family transcriptional regulator [Acetobacteraceae bacterium H6797]|nr:MarR family transcriptional regulator [Acetobacteraceae bacterium H6797]
MSLERQSRPLREPQSQSDTGAADYVLEEQVGHLLRRAYQRHLALFQNIFGEDGPTAMQFAALQTLYTRGALSQNHLGRLIAMDPPTVKGVVARLEARGWVTRASDPDDARLKRVSLTAAAIEAMPGMIERARAVTAATLSPLSREDQLRTLAVLRRMA